MYISSVLYITISYNLVMLAHVFLKEIFIGEYTLKRSSNSALGKYLDEGSTRLLVCIKPDIIKGNKQLSTTGYFRYYSGVSIILQYL